MLKNYIKVALRNLWKSKGFSAINIIGLAAGLGVCLLIVLYVLDEKSYDRYNVNADRIYRLDADLNFNNTQFDGVSSPKPLARTLKHDYPNIVEMVRLNNYGDVMVKKGNSWVQDHHSVYADSTFFKVFTVPMIVGDPNTALDEPHSVVIDETTAKRYFNSTDVLGKTLDLEDHRTCKITGVIRDMPKQSHFHFSFIRPLRDGYNQHDDDEWLSNNYESYILVKPGVSRATLQTQLNQCVNINLGRQLQNVLHASLDDLNKQGSHFRYWLMPLADIHLHSNKMGEFEPNGSITYVYVFSFIAILILVIACVNFMNLSTARSASRAKEVGIRKVAGSTKSDLIFQFLTESILLSFFALVLALGLALLLLPMFNTLAGKELHASTLFSGRILPVIIVLVFVTGCLAGSYPAFYLSSFQPIKVLKGTIAAGFKSSWLRSSLVVFQFWISICLIIGTLVINRQLNYIRNREIGFDRAQVLLVKNAYAAGDPVLTLRKELKNISGITNATLSGDMPSQGGGYSSNGWFREPGLDAKGVVILTNMFVDDNYVPTLGMKMIKGRNFDPASFPTDSSGILVNEAAVALLGWKDPIGQILYRPDGQESSGKFTSKPFHVVGVIKDFNYNSMHEKVLPAVLDLADSRGTLAIRFQGGNIPSLVHQVQKKWDAIAGGVPFTYSFMDNDFNNLYHAEEQTGQVFITFAIFAIVIACLGLFGLVTYAAEQRTKEIGIRKVLGSSVGSIVTLLSRDFIRLVLIASVIAFPISWWGMRTWLQTFAYRVDINWWIFAIAGLVAISIALITVSFQTIRAALANPVSSLRSQ